VPRGRWTCGHCGADWREELADEPEPALAAVDPDAVVTVARFHTPWEAHLARTRLEAEGIAACVLEERLPVVNLLSGEMPARNRLEVSAADARRALAVLDGLVDSADLLAADGES
jgi:hypothetical protein